MPDEEISVKQAIDRITKELNKDQREGSYYYGWHVNIAMSFFDAVRNKADNSASASAPFYMIEKGDLIGICISAAKNFLDLLRSDG